MDGRRSVLAVMVVGVAAATWIPPKPATADPSGDAESVRISDWGELLVAGPVTYKNLAAFVLYQGRKSDQETDYITLEEGIRDGDVSLTEDEREQVQQLRISNRSEKPLFLAAGELVKGGKQDRTMQFSLVIPPGTKEAALPSFCVEQSRWTGGKQFAAGGNIAANASQQALVLLGQHGVWRSVAEYKNQLRANSARASGKAVQPSRTTSLNEELNDSEVKEFLSGYEAALSGIGSNLPRPLGFAYAVDGKMTGLHVFHSSGLFDKLRPKLIRSAAIDAAAGAYDQPPKSLSVQDLREFLAAAWDGKKTEHDLGMKNIVSRYAAQGTFTCELRYRKQLVHVQVGRVDPQLQEVIRQGRQQSAPNAASQLQQQSLQNTYPLPQQIIRPSRTNPDVEPRQQHEAQPDSRRRDSSRSRSSRERPTD